MGVLSVKILEKADRIEITGLTPDAYEASISIPKYAMRELMRREGDVRMVWVGNENTTFMLMAEETDVIENPFIGPCQGPLIAAIIIDDHVVIRLNESDVAALSHIASCSYLNPTREG